MKPKRTLILLTFVIAVLSLAVAYAAITNVDFTISGTATATADQGNFKVEITNASLDGDGAEKSSVTIGEDKLSATINVGGVTKVNEYLQLNLDITNSSSDIYALTTVKISPALTSNYGSSYEKSLKSYNDAGEVISDIGFYITTSGKSYDGSNYDSFLNAPNSTTIDDAGNVTCTGRQPVINPRRDSKLLLLFSTAYDYDGRRC